MLEAELLFGLFAVGVSIMSVAKLFRWERERERERGREGGRERGRMNN